MLLVKVKTLADIKPENRCCVMLIGRAYHAEKF